jgi:predicted RNA-binding protein with PIN domain
MLVFLVDGYNLLHAAPQGELSKEIVLEGQREELIRQLQPLVRKGRVDVQVVFDGPITHRLTKQTGGLTIVFASPSADAYIRQRIGANQQNPQLVVVTSDRKDIGEYARVCGVSWITSQEFWASLNKKSGKSAEVKSKATKRRESPPEGWSPADDDWLKSAFGE